MSITLETYVCLRCGHGGDCHRCKHGLPARLWIQRKPGERPRECSNCHSAYWDRPRKEEKGK